MIFKNSINIPNSVDVVSRVVYTPDCMKISKRDNSIFISYKFKFLSLFRSLHLKFKTDFLVLNSFSIFAL